MAMTFPQARVIVLRSGSRRIASWLGLREVGGREKMASRVLPIDQVLGFGASVVSGVRKTCHLTTGH